MCGVRVIINASEESCSGILSNELGQQMPATRMLIQEFGNVVNEASNDNQGTLGTLLRN